MSSIRRDIRCRKWRTFKGGMHYIFVCAYSLISAVYVFFILGVSDSSAVALNSPPKNKEHIHILWGILLHTRI